MSGIRTLAPRMIGREAQLRELAAHTQEARGGSGRVVFVSGEAGVGKSRLLRDFVDHLSTPAGAAILYGHCDDEDPAVPYGPFIDALQTFLRTHGPDAVASAAGPWVGDLAKLLPDLQPVAPATVIGIDPRSQKRRLFEAIYRIIQWRGESPCRLWILEDVHWADQTSLELLRYLARAIQSDRVLIVCTYRGDELHRLHPLSHLIEQLTRERLHHEVRLSPLSRVDLAHMLESTLERPLPAIVVHVLHERTGGNPFFVEELLKGMVEQNQLDAMIQGTRQGQGIALIEIPLSLKESILSRTADLDETTAAVLVCAAVVGRRFDFELLLRLTGLEEVALLRSVEVLVTRQLVVEDMSGPEDRYSFRHALTREAVYGDLLGRERRLRHRAVLWALEELYQSNPESVVDQLAYHSLHAKDARKAARYAQLAGERAAGMSAHREAVAHYEVALELLETDDHLSRADLYEKLIAAAYPLGDTERYLPYFQEARRLYEQVGDRLKAGDIDRRLSRVFWERGDSEGAFAHARAAIAVLESEPHGYQLALAYGMLSWLNMQSCRPRESIAWGEKALALADALEASGAAADAPRNVEGAPIVGHQRYSHHHVRAAALNNVGTSLTELGEWHRGLAYLESSLETTHRHGLWSEALRAYNNLGDMLALLGEFQRAANVLEKGITAADQHHWELPGVIQNELARAEMALGHWEHARAVLDQAIAAGEMGFRIARLYAIPTHGELLLRQGRLDEARRALEDILPDCETLGEFQILQVLLSTLARVHLARGDFDQAVAVMERCVALWRAIGPVVRATNLLGYGIEVYLATGHGDRVAELLEGLAALANGAATPLALARFADARGMFAAHQGRHDEAVTHFQGAVERWRGMACPYEEALSRRRRAESLLFTSDPPVREEAGRELMAAREIFAGLGALLELAATDTALKRHHLTARPARAGAGRAGTLTPREREVLALIVRGCRNREIAANLVISEKTAEIHVGNILAKLGCTSRAGAAAAALARGLVDIRDCIDP